MGGTGFLIAAGDLSRPCPVLVLLAGDAVMSLTVEPYCLVGEQLHEEGWTVVSLDLPCHGDDIRSSEAPELGGWAARIAEGEDIVAAFVRRMADLTGYMLAERIAELGEIAVAGTSRGGFMALHAAAGCRRIGRVAAFSPVVDLAALQEFRGKHNPALVDRLSLLHRTEALADRDIWITIGKNDRRVGTENVVEFYDALAASATTPTDVRPDRRLRLVDVPGHASFPQWHEDAAAWLLRRT